jgi:hypothetical protein
MQITRRSFVTGLAALSTQSRLAAQPNRSDVLTPEMFGAKGDGSTNDTKAFSDLALAIRANRGGTIELRRTTYIVGAQASAPGSPYFSYIPEEIIVFSGCTRPIVIRGNGATLKCADSLRYGTFDATSGKPTKHAMPFSGGEVATPYRAMIRLEANSGPIEVTDLELDGNLERLRIGGTYGDTGWQTPAAGLALFNNSGSERIRNVHTHHHGQDGLYIDGLSQAVPGSRRLISGVRAEFNGRQGCSIVGGRGYVFENCRFSHTGRSKVSSMPGADVDIEAENGKTNRDFIFRKCEFADNYGVGMVADSGDSEGATFEDCTFIGTTAWSAWPNKPLFRFARCNFVGAIVAAFGDEDRNRAAQFHDCVFRDDPARSPTGKVSLGGYANGRIANMGDRRNVLFNRCQFLLTNEGVLPWSTQVIYADCQMQQRSKAQGYPRATFVGRNVITGNVDLYNSKNLGELVLNGTRYLAPPKPG